MVSLAARRGTLRVLSAGFTNDVTEHPHSVYINTSIGV
jgi:hypothetical protein